MITSQSHFIQLNDLLQPVNASFSFIVRWVVNDALPLQKQQICGTHKSLTVQCDKKGVEGGSASGDSPGQ